MPKLLIQSRAAEHLSISRAIGREATGNSLALASPVQVLEAKGKGAALNSPNEEVASTAAAGAISIQRDNQGSSSFSLPSPSFSQPPAERAHVLHRSLAAELILAGTGTPRLISPARHSEEPGTAISMIAHNDARRNNPNPSVQAPEERASRVEAARLQLAAEQEQLTGRSAWERRSNEARSQAEASSETTPARLATSITPVLDMRFCIEHLEVIRNEAGNSPLSDFSDYWAPDHSKTNPNLPNTFVPVRMLQGSSLLWGPFYNSGQDMRGSDGAPEPDPNHPPYFRVSAELLGRMLHTFKRQYVEDDLRRTTCDLLTSHIKAETEHAKARVSQAAQNIRDKRDSIIGEHDRMIEASQANLREASKVFKETVDKHVAALQTTVQSGASIAQNFVEVTENARRTILASRVSPSLKLDHKELGFVKQLKELQETHHKLSSQHELLQATKSRIAEQLNSAREANKKASLVTANLEEKVKSLEHDKLGLELKQIKLKGEMETLKRKRRSTPSPPPAQPETTPKLRILQRGEKESMAAMESSLSPSSLPPTKKSRSRAKRWDQPAPGLERKVSSPARTPDNVNGKRMEG
jgi:hypothetical protein